MWGDRYCCVILHRFQACFTQCQSLIPSVIIYLGFESFLWGIESFVGGQMLKSLCFCRGFHADALGDASFHIAVVMFPLLCVFVGDLVAVKLVEKIIGENS